MSMHNNALSPEQVFGAISELIEIRRAEGVEYYFLAKLGGDLGISSYDVKSITGLSIFDIVKYKLKYRTDFSDKSKKSIFIYFSEDRPDIKKRSRYPAEIWDAFTKPIEEGRSRFIDVKTMLFLDVYSETILKDGLLNIDRSYLTPISRKLSSGDNNRDSDIIDERIRRWLREKGIPNFLFGPKEIE